MKNKIIKVTIIYSSGKVSVHSMLETETFAFESAFNNAKKRSIKDITPELFIFSSVYSPKTTNNRKKFSEKTLVDLTRVDAISFNTEMD